MKILFSYNKPGWEGEQWAREISAASDSEATWLPFNHDGYVPVSEMLDAVSLDRLYQSGDKRLRGLYDVASEKLLSVDALVATNCPPYHPDWLRKQSVYKVLYTTDDPGATYQRNIPYIHAYDHVFYLNPDYSTDMTMAEKMCHAGAKRFDWMPHGYFDFDVYQAESGVWERDRPVDVVYVGHCFPQKLEMLAQLKRALGSKFVLRGNWKPKHNAYFLAKHGPLQWVNPVSFEERALLHGTAKIGINIHWNPHGVGNQRLYYLPANGAMQICDGPLGASHVFELGKEIICYTSTDEMIDQVRHYLAHPDERIAIARAGWERATRDYSIRSVLARAAACIREGMACR